MKKSMAAALFAVPFAALALELGTPFADNMVLQRDKSVPVWGDGAAPGEEVSVAFAGQTKTAKADAAGAWRVDLDPMPASRENRTLKASAASGSKEIANVLVGEVWFASGQSNMECPIWGGSPRYRDGKGGYMTLATRRPYIRYAKNQKKWSAAPRKGWKAVWRDFSPESFKADAAYELSAVAFYYALEIYGALEVPVGIVDSSWGGTNIDAWTPREAYAKHPELADVAAYPVTEKWEASMKRGPVSAACQQPTALWNGMVAAYAPMAMRGMIWYQGCHNNGEAMRYGDKMHALYDGWSGAFENPGLKLYFVQLAPFKTNWFRLQMEQNRFAAEEPNAALAVTCDAGNLDDIHPNDKETVAKRLALHALKRDYGFDEVIDDSPALKSWRIADGKFHLTFDGAKKWYVYKADRNKDVSGFEVAGETGDFVPAKVLNKVNGAGVFEGTELVVAAEGVAEPLRLRYLASKPWTGTLYSNDSALPLGPFELDARKPEDVRRGPAAKIGDALKVPELAGFRKVLEADIPAYGAFADAGYAFDETKKAGDFTRVAYAFELENRDGAVDWVVATMAAFTDTASNLGVPSLDKPHFQRKVPGLTVRSNVKRIAEGARPKGAVIEFFNSNYSPKRTLADVPGTDDKYDMNDTASNPGVAGYGCMQIHDLESGETLFAYNHINDGTADVGIGSNRDGGHPDWTFTASAPRYRVRRLTVLVK